MISLSANYHILMPVDTETPASSYTRIRAPRGNTLSCKGWQQEAAMRMLMNNLDEDVAERPQDLVVYGGTGKAARNWDCYHAIVRSLKGLENDETLLVQSGKPVGVFKTHEYAPRVLIANSNLVGHFSNWEKFNELERAGLMMYGQMTAGSWIYIGSQGIVQGTYETFNAAGDKHFGGDLSGKLIVSGGMGGMGGAQPLAATMTGAAFLGIDVDPERIKKRLKTGYCDFLVNTLDEALRILKNAVRKKENVSVGLVGNCADIIPEPVSYTHLDVYKRQPQSEPLSPQARAIQRKLHQTIKRVSDDFQGRWHFNTCIAAIMELVNEIYGAEEARAAGEIPVSLIADVQRNIALLLAPMAPYLAHELWEMTGETSNLLKAPWPKYDAALAAEDEIEIPVQVNGKLRGVVVVAAGASDDRVEQAALQDEKVKVAIAGKQIVKKIVVPGKLVNIVVR